MHFFLRRAYFYVDRCLDHLAGAQWQALKWRLNYWRNKIPPIENQAAQPHRRHVIDAVMAFEPVSAIEVGCGRGANLLLLRRRSADLNLSGTDPSPAAVKDARLHLPGMQINVGSLTDLDKLPPHSIDVVLSDAVMMYVPPSEIENSIRSMRRVAARGVVISAWHGEPHYDEGCWIYDFGKYGPAQVRPFPAGSWNDARWEKYGALVTYPPLSPEELDAAPH